MRLHITTVLTPIPLTHILHLFPSRPPEFPIDACLLLLHAGQPVSKRKDAVRRCKVAQGPDGEILFPPSAGTMVERAWSPIPRCLLPLATHIIAFLTFSGVGIYSTVHVCPGLN